MSAGLRTLIVSDLHLGARLGRDALRRPEALAALLDALDDVDRLVLLGDVVELLEGDPRAALAAAEPVLRAVGARMGPERAIVVVPGNHDRPFVRPWLRAHPEATSVLDGVIPGNATPLLASLTAFLAPARVEVRYPGVWLTPRVWATHGHYLDRHLVPATAYGVARGALGRQPRADSTAADYEFAGGPSLTGLEGRIMRSLPLPSASLFDRLVDLVRASTMPTAPRRPRMSWLTVRVLGIQMRRASIPAVARVAERLGVDADHVIFGHVHRLGPVDGDDPRQWQGPGGHPAILNTGGWVYEPPLVHGVTPPHPYWPGGAVVIDGHGPPRAVSLLDHLPAEAFGDPGRGG
ncbi:MAG: metallophosphoesterase [Solirubrobacteraceae bacterium]